jgi:hypothetical protein
MSGAAPREQGQPASSGISEINRMSAFAALMQVIFSHARLPASSSVGEDAQVYARFIALKLKALGIQLEPEINAELSEALVLTLAARRRLN